MAGLLVPKRLWCPGPVIFCFVLSVTLGTAQRSSKDVVSLVFVGDISFDGPVKYYSDRHYHTYNETFDKVASILRQADLAIGNLESPFVNQSMLEDKYSGSTRKTVVINADPTSVSALSYSGLDIMTLANNHMNDYGERPVNFTVDVLNAVGIKSFGVNFGSHDAPQEALIVEKKGIKIGFLGYCDVVYFTPKDKVSGCYKIRKAYKAGPVPYSNHSAARDVKNLKAQGVDVIIVYIHWGIGYCQGLDIQELRVKRYLESLGVQIIIGTHPHLLQPHSMSGGNITVFSLGNFLFAQHGTPFSIFYRGRGLPNNEKLAMYEKEAILEKGPTKFARIYRLNITRSGLRAADYLPLEITFNASNKCLQPIPKKGTHWIDVCEPRDKACVKMDHQPIEAMCPGPPGGEPPCVKCSDLKATDF